MAKRHAELACKRPPLPGIPWQEAVVLSAKSYCDRPAYPFYVRCGDRTWEAHHEIILRGCPVLYEARLKVGEVTAILEKQVPSAVHSMLDFLYTAKYDDTDFDDSEYTEPEDATPLMHNIYVHVLARKLKLPALAALALHKFAKLANSGSIGPHFRRAVKEVYTAEHFDHTSALREQVLNSCAEIFVEPTVLNGPASVLPAGITTERLVSSILLEEILEEMPQFKAELTQRLADGPTTVFTVVADPEEERIVIDKTYRCRKCDGTFTVHEAVLSRVLQMCPFCGLRQKPEQWNRDVIWKGEANDGGRLEGEEEG